MKRYSVGCTSFEFLGFEHDLKGAWYRHKERHQCKVRLRVPTPASLIAKRRSSYASNNAGRGTVTPQPDLVTFDYITSSIGDATTLAATANDNQVAENLSNETILLPSPKYMDILKELEMRVFGKEWPGPPHPRIKTLEMQLGMTHDEGVSMEFRVWKIQTKASRDGC